MLVNFHVNLNFVQQPLKLWWNIRRNEREVDLGKQSHLPQKSHAGNPVRPEQSSEETAAKSEADPRNRRHAPVDLEHPFVSEGILRSVLGKLLQCTNANYSGECLRLPVYLGKLSTTNAWCFRMRLAFHYAFQ